MAAPSSGNTETAAFAAQRQIRSMVDVRALEAGPLERAVTARSTYEILRNAAHSFGDRVALTFLPSAEPDATPIRWSFAELLARVHQTANALHTLGVGPPICSESAWMAAGMVELSGMNFGSTSSPRFLK